MNAKSFAAISCALALALVGCTSRPAKPHASPALSPTPATSESEEEGPELRVCSGAPANFGDNGRVIRFIDSRRGWVAAGPTIFATTDGGRTWKRQYHDIASFLQLDFVDAQRGWAVGCDLLLRTTDGGKHWSRRPQPSHPVVAVDFTTSHIGLGISRGGFVYRTEDSGQTWRGLSSAGTAQSMCLASRLVGWIGDRRGVRRSTDGGKSWRRVFTVKRDASWTAGSLGCHGSAVWALFQGGAAAGSQGYAVYRTLDGGSSWRLVLGQFVSASGNSSVPRIDAYSGAFHVVNTNLAWFTGVCPACDPQPRPSISGTSDGGRHWDHHIVRDQAGSPQSVFFTDSLRGWIVLGPTASPGKVTLFATSDGGKAWHVQLREAVGST